MANYDKSLDRMMFLMGYDNSLNESKKTNNGIECHRTGADGKEYGIIKEGMRYYIKTTTPEKMNIAESYEYIGGHNYRNENGYNSYNEATKQLELRLMNLNESLGKHEDVSIANLDKTKQAMNMLTESARQELDRMHAIFENSFISKDNIGNHGNPEGKGTSTGVNTKKNNAPFDETASATLDKDMKKEGTVDGATSDHKDVKDADNKLQHADKMERGNRGDEEYKDTHDDLDGEGVADQKKSGKMNEEVEDVTPELDYEEDAYADDAMIQGDKLEGLEDFGDGPSDIEYDSNSDEIDYDAFPMTGDEDIDPVGLNEELDDLLREFMEEDLNFGPSVNVNGGEGGIGNGNTVSPSTEVSAPIPMEESENVENGGEEGLKSFNRAGDGRNGVGNEKTMDKMDEEVEVGGAGEDENCITGPCDVLDHHTAKPGKNGVHGEKTMDKMNEAIERITDMVYASICKENGICPTCGKKKCTCDNGKCKCDKKETLEEAIQRIVNEEVTRLDAWGKHPRFRKAPMTTPANKEVLAGTAKGDWNDDSVKGEHPYGLKIGDSAPFNKTVDMLTDQVLANLKESLRLGK